MTACGYFFGQIGTAERYTLLKRDNAFIWEAIERKALYEIKALALISNAPLPSESLKPY